MTKLPSPLIFPTASEDSNLFCLSRGREMLVLVREIKICLSLTLKPLTLKCDQNKWCRRCPKRVKLKGERRQSWRQRVVSVHESRVVSLSIEINLSSPLILPSVTLPSVPKMAATVALKQESGKNPFIVKSKNFTCIHRFHENDPNRQFAIVSTTL